MTNNHDLPTLLAHARILIDLLYPAHHALSNPDIQQFRQQALVCLNDCEKNPHLIDTSMLLQWVNQLEAIAKQQDPVTMTTPSHQGLTLNIEQARTAALGEHATLISSVSVYAPVYTTNYPLSSETASLEQVTSTLADNMLTQILKQTYQKQANIHLLLHPQIVLPISNCFINLTILNSAEQQRAEQETLRQRTQSDASRDEWLAAHEDMYATRKTTIRPEAILDTRNISEKPKHQVLIEGRAGMGKSTLCQYLAYQWAVNKLWPQFRAIFWIRLRNLINYPEHELTIAHIVHRECLKRHNNLSLPALAQWIEQNADHCLWNLDGYDEIVQHLGQSQSPLAEVVTQLLANKHRIVTSRPGFYRLEPQERHLDISGFDNDAMYHYVHRFFQHTAPDQASNLSHRLTKTLQYQSALHGIAHIPILLELLCSRWLDQETCIDDNDAPLTLTRLYQDIITYLIYRHLQRKGRTNLARTDPSILWKDPAVTPLLDTLARISWEARNQGKVILPPALYRPCLTNDVDIDDLFNHFGLLKRIGHAKALLQQQTYYFIHLSFQELFEAHYFMQILLSLNHPLHADVIALIQQERWNPRYQLVWIFLAGLLRDHPQALIHYFTLLEPPQYGQYLHHYGIALLARCYEEAYQLDTKTLLQAQFDRLKTAFEQHTHHLLTYKNFYERRSSSPFLNAIQSTSILQQLLSHAMEKTWLKLLAESDKEHNNERLERVLAIIYLFRYATPTLQKALFSFLANRNDQIRYNVCTAISQFNINTNFELQEELLPFLTDKHPGVRDSAIAAIGQLGAHLSPKLKQTLLAYLAYRNPEVHYGIQEVVSNHATSELQQPVSPRSIYGQPDIHNGICATIAKLAAKDPTEWQQVLLPYFTSTNITLRQSVCRIVWKLGIYTSTRLQQALLLCLTDDAIEVRGDACTAVGELGTYAISELQQALLLRIYDQHPVVARNALLAINKLDVHAIPGLQQTLLRYMTDPKCMYGNVFSIIERLGNSIIPELQQMLLFCLINTNLTAETRQNACMVIARLGTHTILELQQALLPLFQDENPIIRTSACLIIAALGVHTTPELQLALLPCLNDLDLAVYHHAFHAVAQIGTHLIPELHQHLLLCLTDPAPKIRQTACITIRQLGYSFRELEPMLLPLLLDQDHQVCQITLSTIRQWDKNVYTQYNGNSFHKIMYRTPGVIPGTIKLQQILLSYIKDQNFRYRHIACDIVGQLSDPIPELIQVLLDCRIERDFALRRSAYIALIRLYARGNNELHEIFLSSLGDQDEFICQITYDFIFKLKYNVVDMQIMLAITHNIFKYHTTKLPIKSILTIIADPIIRQCVSKPYDSDDCYLLLGWIFMLSLINVSVEIGKYNEKDTIICWIDHKPYIYPVSTDYLEIFPQLLSLLAEKIEQIEKNALTIEELQNLYLQLPYFTKSSLAENSAQPKPLSSTITRSTASINATRAMTHLLAGIGIWNVTGIPNVSAENCNDSDNNNNMRPSFNSEDVD